MSAPRSTLQHAAPSFPTEVVEPTQEAADRLPQLTEQPSAWVLAQVSGSWPTTLRLTWRVWTSPEIVGDAASRRYVGELQSTGLYHALCRTLNTPLAIGSTQGSVWQGPRRRWVRETRSQKAGPSKRHFHEPDRPSGSPRSRRPAALRVPTEP